MVVIDEAPAPPPPPPPAPPSPLWSIDEGSSLIAPATKKVELATNVSDGLTCAVFPELLPGQSLQKDGTTLNLVSDATVPEVDGAVPGSPLDAISGRVRDIVLTDSPYAVIQNMTKGTTYQPGQSYSGYNGQPAGRWNWVMGHASPGDVLEVSPGVIHEVPSDRLNYWSNNLSGALLAVWKPCTIRNANGQGRWKPYLPTDLMSGSVSGIVIYSPKATDPAGRGDFTLEGFEFDNWGNTSDSCGIKIMNNASTDGSWAHMHRSLTLRNFKIGKPPFERSASGILGEAEIMVLEDGHVYDTGGGLYSPDGNDHNAYVSARSLSVFGVRFQRSRGLNAQGWWVVPDTDMDGHMLKASAVNALIEGCCFDADPIYGDNTHHIQAKAGGNFVIRGNLFVDSLHNQNQGRGPINMCREGASTVPNFEWWAGLEGNSLIIERNVFVGHYGRAAVYFFPAGHGNNLGLTMSAVIIRDNIGMITTTPTVLAPFDSTKWILNDPLNGGSWAARGNSEEPYDVEETPFADRALKLYTRKAGPIQASGSLETKRFVWPHGAINRADTLRGLA